MDGPAPENDSTTRRHSLGRTGPAAGGLIHSAGLSLTLGRILHAVGLHTGALNLGRALGVTLTLLSYLLIGAGLIYAGLSQQL